jgi:hypothetical protein
MVCYYVLISINKSSGSFQTARTFFGGRLEMTDSGKSHVREDGITTSIANIEAEKKEEHDDQRHISVAKHTTANVISGDSSGDSVFKGTSFHIVGDVDFTKLCGDLIISNGGLVVDNLSHYQVLVFLPGTIITKSTGLVIGKAIVDDQWLRKQIAHRNPSQAANADPTVRCFRSLFSKTDEHALNEFVMTENSATLEIDTIPNMWPLRDCLKKKTKIIDAGSLSLLWKRLDEAYAASKSTNATTCKLTIIQGSPGIGNSSNFHYLFNHSSDQTDYFLFDFAVYRQVISSVHLVACFYVVSPTP